MLWTHGLAPPLCREERAGTSQEEPAYALRETRIYAAASHADFVCYLRCHCGARSGGMARRATEPDLATPCYARGGFDAAGICGVSPGHRGDGALSAHRSRGDAALGCRTRHF